MVSSTDPAASGDGTPSEPGTPLSPGDEAPSGTPGTGEDVCPACGGRGAIDGKTCRHCRGTGTVTVGIGGA